MVPEPLVRDEGLRAGKPEREWDKGKKKEKGGSCLSFYILLSLNCVISLFS